MRLWNRARMGLRRREFEADLAEEIRVHREMSGDAAAFGSEALVLEESREVWGLAWLESWRQDIRYALRGWRRTPGFALGVIAAIALGLGLNTTMFTVFSAYALRPNAVRNPYSLYSVSWYAQGNGHRFTLDQYRSLRRIGPPFTDVLATANLTGQAGGRPLFLQAVSGNYFDMLGVGMAQGRPLLESDTGAVVVMSHEIWRNRFGGDPDIVGRKVYVRGMPFEVAGVVNERFAGLDDFPTGYWIPLAVAPTLSDTSGATDTGETLQLVGSLQSGVTPEAAKGPLLAWAKSFAPQALGIVMIPRATTVPLNRDAIISFVPLFAAFGLVLLIACANVSNMMLARALARRREVAIRISLGAGRWRLIRQLLTESALLALPSAAVGFAVSELTIAGARRLLFATVPEAFARFLSIKDLTPDWRVFEFVLAASVATALLFGLIPAIQTTRSRLVEANRGDFSSDRAPARLRNLLVVAQVSVCVFLLITTAIVLRSRGRVMAQPTGLDTSGVWDIRAPRAYQPKIAARMAQEPGVVAVAAAWRAPLYGFQWRLTVSAPGAGKSAQPDCNYVSAHYFSSFHVPLRGRDFTAEESEAEAPVAIVSESLARRLWPGADPIGQSIAVPHLPSSLNPRQRRPPFASFQVVGVAGDIVTYMIANAVETSALYLPTHAGGDGNDSVLVRIPEDRARARRRLEAALDQVAPGTADFVNPMDDVLALQVYPFRVTAWVGMFLAGVAMVLTISGIYAVMSYLVSQRTKEIGIRMALGAGVRDAVGLVARQSAWLAGIGAVLGAGMALAIAPVFAHQVEAIQPYEWTPYVVTAALVFGAAVAASYVPARRAAAIDPVRTLRCD